MLSIELISVLLVIGMSVCTVTMLAMITDPRDNPMREFAVMGLFCAGLMMLSYHLELNEPGLTAKISAVKIGYVGRVLVNPMLLTLVFRYYRIRFSRVLQVIMYLIPFSSLIAVLTYPTSDLFYENLGLAPNGLLLIEPGPLYYVYMGFNTLLGLICLTFCLYRRVGLAKRERQNNTLLMLAVLVPLLTLLVYLSGWTNSIDISSIGVLIGSLLVSISILRFGLLNKEEMLQNMATGLIFLDGNNRLVYANRVALQILPALSKAKSPAHHPDLGMLLSEEFAAVQIGTATYQRKITAWTNGEGQTGKLLTFDDITEIRARLNRDAMTGMLNHASFYPMLDDALSESVQRRKKVTVAIADIDSFKRVNDNYGHANGDIILIALADTLRKVCGPHGDVFRYGGEEFAVIFSGNFALAEEIMQDALDIFSACEFDFLPYHVTFSYGCAEYDGVENSVALFERADQLMYRRKRALHAREEMQDGKAV